MGLTTDAAIALAVAANSSLAELFSYDGCQPNWAPVMRDAVRFLCISYCFTFPRLSELGFAGYSTAVTPNRPAQPALCETLFGFRNWLFPFTFE